MSIKIKINALSDVRNWTGAEVGVHIQQLSSKTRYVGGEGEGFAQLFQTIGTWLKINPVIVLTRCMFHGHFVILIRQTM